MAQKSTLGSKAVSGGGVQISQWGETNCSKTNCRVGCRRRRCVEFSQWWLHSPSPGGSTKREGGDKKQQKLRPR